jgi:hypothetical protein
VSFTDPQAPWVTQPAPGEPVPLRMVLLAALAYTALDLRDTGQCDFCGLMLCAGHRSDAELAATCEAAYAQVAAGPADWAMLAITLQAGLN